MTETRWWKYMQGLMGEQSQLDAANQIGISKSNITRWKDGARAAPDFVVKVARAYGANVLEALVEAEFITEEEAALKHVSPDIDLTKIDGADLAAEHDYGPHDAGLAYALDVTPHLIRVWRGEHERQAA